MRGNIKKIRKNFPLGIDRSSKTYIFAVELEKRPFMKSPKDDPFSYNEEKIARENIKRGETHAMFLGGPSPKEAKKKLKERFGYSDKELKKLER